MQSCNDDNNNNNNEQKQVLNVAHANWNYVLFMGSFLFRYPISLFFFFITVRVAFKRLLSESAQVARCDDLEWGLFVLSNHRIDKYRTIRLAFELVEHLRFQHKTWFLSAENHNYSCKIPFKLNRIDNEGKCSI